MYIEQINSTNTLIRKLSPEEGYIYTFHQTAGRGQEGNRWESAPGQNLLFSYILRASHPLEARALPPLAGLFDLNILASVALYRTIAPLLPVQKVGALTIKWPNDLYFSDCKLAGILVENTLATDSVLSSIAGIGLNVHQTVWYDGAPNPISITQITGGHYDLHMLMRSFIANLTVILSNPQPEELRREYLDHLYRKQGWHKYQERPVDSTPTAIAYGDGFTAAFENITPQGELILRLQDNSLRKYHFKQIRYVL